MAKDVHLRMCFPEEQSFSGKCLKWSNVLLLTISYSCLPAEQLRWAHLSAWTDATLTLCLLGCLVFHTEHMP